MSEAQDARLGARAAAGTTWVTGASYAGYAVNLVTGVLLARLLDPEHFGTVALAASLIVTLNMLTAWGLGAAIVARPEIDERFLGTVLSLLLLLGLGVFAIVALVAWLWSPNEPLVALILAILGLLQVGVITAQVPQLLLQRDLEFRRVAVVDVLAVVAEGGVALGLARAGFGVWSLVAGRLAGGLTQILGYWLGSPWRPALALDRELARWCFDFGKSFFIINNLVTIQSRLDDILVGVFAGKAALGLYSKSFLLSETVGQTIAPGLGRVMLPAFRTIREDSARLSELYRYVIWGVLRVMILYSALVALLARPLVALVFGDKWLPMVPMLRLLLIYGGLRPVYTPTRSLLVALGHQEKVARVALAETALFLPGIIVFTFLGGAVWAAIVVDVTTLLGIAWLIRRVPRDIETHVLRDALAPLLAGGLAAAPVWTLLQGPLLDRPHWETVLLGGASFVALYGLLLWLLERRRLIHHSTTLLRELRGAG